MALTKVSRSQSEFGVWGPSKPKSRYTPIDCRRNIHELENGSVSGQSISVACLIQEKLLKKELDGSFTLQDFTPTLKDKESKLHAPFGEDEKFPNEPVPGYGTGFLVTDKHLLTARHCVCMNESTAINKDLMEDTYVVFGFQKTESDQTEYTFPKRDVYKVKKIVVRSDQYEDWALIKLDREVEGRAPLNVNFAERLAQKTALYMLGHPSGLPLKYAGHAKAKVDKPSYFEADLQAFGGNSGSPVFDEKSGDVVGILVRGNKDYEVVEDYRGRGHRRVRTCYTSPEKALATGYERVQRLDHLDFLRKYILAYLGNLDAQYELGKSFCEGTDGVLENRDRGIKWLQRASEPGIDLTYITIVALREYIATACLSFGPRALEMQRNLTLGNAASGTVISVLSIPLLTIPAWIIIHNGLKSDKARKFEMLALDDPRFQFFTHLAHNELEEADRAFNEHDKLLRMIMKTNYFLEQFIECIENCNNSTDYGRDKKKGNTFIEFLIGKGAISKRFEKLLIPDVNSSDNGKERD